MNVSTEGDCHRVAESRELYDIERRFLDKDPWAAYLQVSLIIILAIGTCLASLIQVHDLHCTSLCLNNLTTMRSQQRGAEGETAALASIHVRYKDKPKITARIRGETAVFERTEPWSRVYSAIAGFYKNEVPCC